ncbi:hypothetical protein [Pontixanthobacter aquaemixtae]|uniref:Uncharacterized protein n=1 Tax=Pontixanthobacter aquaemixtae TaxID=1958940 RepID=A0A844ZTC2_9SPHN|nr:hypothetical protein [Pontixanthobacter aquaemixtae]MXO90552.1 hypothetical protein [Pontixanthobacter aquaemixtae]
MLLLPAPAGDVDARVDEPATGAKLAAQMPEAQPVNQPAWVVVEGANGLPVQYQVRIDQRVVIRVSPRRPATRQDLNAPLPQQTRPRRLVERKIGKCVKMNQISGVQPTRDNRLILYLRSNKMIAANLEKTCSVRDFYSGFYVEPSEDGNLCINRDKLQSRTGVKCKLSKIRQLVPERS